MSKVNVNAPNVEYVNQSHSNGYIHSKIDYHTSKVIHNSNGLTIVPETKKFEFKTSTNVPKVGLMMVGWGGNNGTTLTGTLLANKHKLQWNSKEGTLSSNFYGSVCMSSTMSIGFDSENMSKEVFVPWYEVVPMVDPCDIVIGGWDINKLDMAESMRRSQVFDYELQEKLYPMMKNMNPLPSIYKQSFIALNQKDRANNIINGNLKEQIETIRKDIQDFKVKNSLQKVIILWTANTERYCDEMIGIHDNVQNLLKAIDSNHEEISPSTCFAVASILEKCSFINGSPQNTLVGGVVELANIHGTFVGGDDFKTGQTKLKSVLVDFLIGSGIKPRSIVSYNHLGNNDGLNLSAPCQFKSKEISKSGVVEDMVESNGILYKKDEKPDHCIVIKYVPYVGDSKRAMDEYISEICMGGQNTLVIHNTCEDSLLACTVMLDLVMLTELFERIGVKITDNSNQTNFNKFNSVLSFLGFLLKAPQVPNNTPIVNSLFKQRTAIENLLRALIGLQPNSQLQLEHRL